MTFNTRPISRNSDGVPTIARIQGDDGFDDSRSLAPAARGPLFLGRDGRPETLTLYDLRRLRDLVEIDGRNDFELLMSWLRLRANGDASHDEIFARARQFKRRLDDGESVSLPGVVPEFSGTGSPEDQARQYLEEQLGDGWKSLPPSVQVSAISALLAEVEAAAKNTPNQTELSDDDETVGAFTLAVRRIEARDLAFRGRDLALKIRDPRVRAEADRIQLRRAERTQANERALSEEADDVDSADPCDIWNVDSITELSTFPPARGVQSLVGKAITMMSERQPSFASHDWREQVRQATALVSSLQSRASSARAGGAR
jgi:hypothetical protein